MNRSDCKTKDKVLSIDHFSKGNNLPFSFSSCSFILKHGSSKGKIFRKLQLGAGIALLSPKPADPDCAEKRVAIRRIVGLSWSKWSSLQIALKVKWNRSFNFPFLCAGKAVTPYSTLLEDFKRSFFYYWDRERTASCPSGFPAVGKYLVDLRRQQIKSLKCYS